jgi:hypothetical protein
MQARYYKARLGLSVGVAAEVAADEVCSRLLRVLKYLKCVSPIGEHMYEKVPSHWLDFPLLRFDAVGLFFLFLYLCVLLVCLYLALRRIVTHSLSLSLYAHFALDQAQEAVTSLEDKHPTLLYYNTFGLHRGM